MVLLDGATIPPGRMVFFPKLDLKSHELDIQADGPVGLYDRGDLWALRNHDPKAAVTVTVRVREPS